MDGARVHHLLDTGDLARLFIELGWDNPPELRPTVEHPEDGVTATPIADKKGVGVWLVGSIPDAPVRRRLDILVARETRERLLVFAAADRQLWLWPEQRSSGSGYRLVEHIYVIGSKNEDLVQRLLAARFRMDEESSLTVLDVRGRVRRSFNADQVTKKFYREFREHHAHLLDAIDGIPVAQHVAWYGSVLLNRLMFVYFMQKKGFLADDRDYLRNRLQMVREHLGKDAFYGFFKQFLLPFFHDGLGSHGHEYDDPAIAEIVGDIPYVNGGIFDVHQLEKQHDIDVPDKAFEEIFRFFDQYKWHLDDRPTDDPNEINPDVLGYIFEQFVNQKEQGAYYTKEDVTGYMTAATVIPVFFDRLGVVDEFVPLLAQDPDRFIFESVRYGSTLPLPGEIAAGVEDPTMRSGWAEKAPPTHGLPGETWWEAIDRFRYLKELRRRLADGDVESVDTCVTLNLDIRLLVVDYIQSMRRIEDVTAAYQHLATLTVLDPTCGSGAFLFAALEILVEMYEAILERAVELSADGEPPKFVDDLRSHQNRSYAVIKAAVLNNLFGVDLMAEAGEIARLRLFLKLVAQLGSREEIEPLPDLDLNIKAGNLLVGIASIDDARTRLGSDLLGLMKLEEIEKTAEKVSIAYREFVKEQQGPWAASSAGRLKSQIRKVGAALRETLDSFLHEVRAESANLSDWIESHSPFHWFVEFPQVFERGGFDVVIGNPPYIPRKGVSGYRYRGFETQDCPDIYAPCLERSLHLLRPGGRFGLVLPHSICFSSGFGEIRSVVSSAADEVWLSHYALMPDALFTGVRVRNSIVIGRSGPGDLVVHSGWRNRWTVGERPHLFPKLRYALIPAALHQAQWPFLGSEDLAGWILSRTRGENLGSALRPEGIDMWGLRYKQVAGYYVSMWPAEIGDPPSVDAKGNSIPHTKVGTVWFETRDARDIAFALGVGKWFLVWWLIWGDDFDVTQGVLSSFPIDPRKLEPRLQEEILGALPELEAGLAENVTFKGYKYKGKAGARMANYHIPSVRNLTDSIDEIVAQEMAAPSVWEAVNIGYARLASRALEEGR